ncbi:MAG: glutathione transferase GstA [Parasphingorhabdus sp.]
MKLYYKPGACSLATHITLYEAGAPFEVDEVDTEAGCTKSGKDYKSINPKGYVPALELSDESVLTEGAAVLQYVADQNPESSLAPKAGSIERTRVQEYLSYTGSELHKAFGPFFSDTASDVDKEKAGVNVASKFDYLNEILNDGRDYLVGNSFSVADAYLFVVSNWSNSVGIDLTRWPHIAAFVDRVSKRPATQVAMKAEGLI